MTQEIQNYKLNWLRGACFRVEVKDLSDADKAKEWLSSNVDEKSYESSINPQEGVHTFFFELAQDASRLREELYGDNRTIDLS